jgi:AcrR family transcriptional regulator
MIDTPASAFLTVHAISGRGRLDRDRILSAAAEIADTDGLETVNVARLARHLRVKITTIQRCLPDSTTIRDALATRALSELIELIRDVTRGREGRDALQAFAHGLRTYAQARPGRYLSIIRGGHGRQAVVSTLRQSLLRSVAAMLESYGLDGDAALDISRCVLAAIQGFIVVELSGGVGSPFEVDQSYQRLLDMLDAGARASARSLSTPRKAGRSGRPRVPVATASAAATPL